MRTFINDKRRVLIFSGILAIVLIIWVIYFIIKNLPSNLIYEEATSSQNQQESIKLPELENTFEDLASEQYTSESAETSEQGSKQEETQQQGKVESSNITNSEKQQKSSQSSASKVSTPEAQQQSSQSQQTPTLSKPTASSKPVSSVPTASSSSYTDEVVRLCNIERQKAGLAALSNNNSKLQQAANLRASEIKQSFSHTRPNGSNFYSVLKEFGVSYSYSGENIAYGQRTPQEVVNGWMNSSGHKANILNSNFNQIAVGLDGTHWVQLFIKG